MGVRVRGPQYPCLSLLIWKISLVIAGGCLISAVFGMPKDFLFLFFIFLFFLLFTVVFFKCHIAVQLFSFLLCFFIDNVCRAPSTCSPVLGYVCCLSYIIIILKFDHKKKTTSTVLAWALFSVLSLGKKQCIILFIKVKIDRQKSYIYWLYINVLNFFERCWKNQ